MSDEGDGSAPHLERAVEVGRVDHEGGAESSKHDDEDVVADLEHV